MLKILGPKAIFGPFAWRETCTFAARDFVCTLDLYVIHCYTIFHFLTCQLLICLSPLVTSVTSAMYVCACAQSVFQDFETCTLP